MPLIYTHVGDDIELLTIIGNFVYCMENICNPMKIDE
jgi:hypothetical protein